MDKFITRGEKRPRDDEGDAAAAAVPPPLAPEATALFADLQDSAWRTALQKEAGKSYFADLARSVAAQRRSKTVYPPANEVFNAFNLTSLPDVRVVILGQDPCARCAHRRACACVRVRAC